MLGPAQHIAGSDSRELHDGCLVFKVDLGQRKCLFTGDALDKNLAYVAETTTHSCDGILHASHHGSLNGAEINFVKACNAQYSVISTQTGVHKNVPHPVALRRYADYTERNVYRTDTNGTLTWEF